MEQIKLSQNHRRSVTSSLLVVENNLIEIERMLKLPVNGHFSQIIVDIPVSGKKEALLKIRRIRKVIGDLYTKYGLYTRATQMSWYIDSRKSILWEILCETSSKRLKGFGEVNPELAKEFDRDINQLQELISSI